VTGTVQFQLCSNTTTGCPQGTGTNIGSPVTLVNGSATSPVFGANLAPGNYCVGLVYVNDGLSFYSSAYAGGVVGECFTVTTAATSITTSLSINPIVVGGSVHDSATLTGATASAGGTVGYRFYPSLAACQADTSTFTGTQPTGGTSAGTVTVTNGAVPNSNTVTFPNAGTFFWAAFNSGDQNNTATASACSGERLAVTKPTPLPVTGTPTAQVAALAGCLLAAGLTLLLAARRWRTQH